MALRLCKKCRKTVLSKAVQCPYCGNPMEQHEEEIICKINNVDYDFTEIYKKMMAIDKNNLEWSHSEEMLEIIWEVYDLTQVRGTSSFCIEAVETGILPSEYNAMTVEEWKEQVKKSTQNHVTIRCPYCGSLDVRRNIGFIGRHRLFVPSASLGKNWKCKSCGSYF